MPWSELSVNQRVVLKFQSQTSQEQRLYQSSEKARFFFMSEDEEDGSSMGNTCYC